MEKKKPENTAEEEKTENKNEERKEEVPLEASPYVNYKDLEDYKRKAYGTEGHLQPKPGRGAAASTDAPTSTLAATQDR
ncbi:uncharacterized protein LOC110822435 [Carica papaya]|uniref:uncharacterized protein LOC110822435 n=1 Tax=Carica papaya TaxID=3649 RepID=UPI000B8C6FB1|nr:uncharacterized protein LOC110822435 [Carica papaya]